MEQPVINDSGNLKDTDIFLDQLKNFFEIENVSRTPKSLSELQRNVTYYYTSLNNPTKDHDQTALFLYEEHMDPYGVMTIENSPIIIENIREFAQKHGLKILLSRDLQEKNSAINNLLGLVLAPDKASLYVLKVPKRPTEK